MPRTVELLPELFKSTKKHSTRTASLWEHTLLHTEFFCNLCQLPKFNFEKKNPQKPTKLKHLKQQNVSFFLAERSKLFIIITISWDMFHVLTSPFMTQ